MFIQLNVFAKLQFSYNTLRVCLALAFIAWFYFYANSAWAQDASPGSLSYQPIVVKIISAEVIKLPKPKKIIGARQVFETDQAMLMKTAVVAREFGHFPPARQPLIHIGERRYPILKQEVDNWDYVNEKPIDPEQPVGNVLFLYALIPDWQELPDQQRVWVAVDNPEDRAEDSSDAGTLVNTLATSHAVFDKSIVIDQR